MVIPAVSLLFLHGKSLFYQRYKGQTFLIPVVKGQADDKTGHVLALLKVI